MSPFSTFFKESFSNVDPDEDKLRDDDGEDIKGPKEEWPSTIETPLKSGTLASERQVGTEEDSGGEEREAQANVSRDLPARSERN